MFEDVKPLPGVGGGGKGRGRKVGRKVGNVEGEWARKVGNGERGEMGEGARGMG